MAKNPVFEPVFQRLLDDPAGSLDLLRADFPKFEASVIDEEQGHLSPDAAIPSLDSIAALVFDEAGQVVNGFGPQWLPEVASFPDLQSRVTMPAHHPHMLSIRDEGGSAVHAIWANNRDAMDWNLPRKIRNAIGDHP